MLEKDPIYKEVLVIDEFEIGTKILGNPNTKGKKNIKSGHIDKQRPLNSKELTGVSDNEFNNMVADIKSGKIKRYI